MEDREMIARITKMVMEKINRPQMANSGNPSSHRAVNIEEGISSVTPSDSELIRCVQCVASDDRPSSRAVITATGKNRPGILAALTSLIADCNGDIHDISQTIVGGFYSSVMVVDLENLNRSFGEFKEVLESLTDSEGIQTVVLHEDLINKMHRV